MKTGQSKRKGSKLIIGGWKVSTRNQVGLLAIEVVRGTAVLCL